MKVTAVVWGDHAIEISIESKFYRIHSFTLVYSLLYMNFYINQKPKFQTLPGDTFSLLNKNHKDSAYGGENPQSFQIPLNPTTSPGFAFFSQHHPSHISLIWDLEV